MKQLATIAAVDAVMLGFLVFAVTTHALPIMPVVISIFVSAVGFNAAYLYRNFGPSRKKCGGDTGKAESAAKDLAIIARAKRNNGSLLRAVLVLIAGGLALMLTSAVLRLYAHGWNIPDGIRLIWVGAAAYVFLAFFRMYRKAPGR